MKSAIDETNRRRTIQMQYNLENNITPKTIIKDLKEPPKIKEDYKEYIGNKSKKINKKQKEQMIKQ